MHAELASGARGLILVLALIYFHFYVYHNNKGSRQGCPQYGLRREKICLPRFANNKCADQPAHLRSLASTFVIHLLEYFISKLATSEISAFYLVSVADETGLSLTFLETLKTGFVRPRPICYAQAGLSLHCSLM